MFFRTILLFHIATSFTASAASITLHTEEAVERALTNNPTIAAARFRIDEARGRLHQAGRLANPELELEASQNTRTPEQSYGVGISQALPLSTRLRWEKSIARSGVAMAEAELRDAARRLRREVRDVCIRILAIQKLQRLRKDQFLTNDDLARILKSRAQAGEVSPAEAAQIALESTQLLLAASQLDVEKAALLGELRTLLGLTEPETIQLSGELASPGATPRTSVDPASRGDLQAAQILLQSGRDAVALSKAERWGDADLGVFAEQVRAEDAPEGLERERLVGLRLSVPMPLWNRNQGKIAETQAAAFRIESELQALKQRAQNEADAALHEMQVLARVLGEMDNQLLPQAYEIEKLQQHAHSQGLLPLSDTVRARQNRQALQVQRFETLRDYHLARIRHLAATGDLPTP